MSSSTRPLERRLVRTTPPPACDSQRIREIRQALNVSQGVFAELLNVSLATVQAWERGARAPDGASLRLLELAAQHPHVILATLTPARERRP